MSEDQINVKITPLFTFGLTKKDHEIVIKEGQTIILRYWSWRKFGFMRKAITIKDGDVQVEVI